MENYIFISYSTKNSVKTRKFKSLMEKSGISCWMAPDSIDVGFDYARAIPSAIRNCRLVVVLLSEAAQKSQWVPKEVDLAFKYEKPILPILIEKCEIVEPFDFYLSNVQTVSLSMQKSESAQKVVDRIKAYLNLEVALDGKKDGETVVVTTRGSGDAGGTTGAKDELESMYERFADSVEQNGKVKTNVLPDIKLLSEYEPIDKEVFRDGADETASKIERVLSARLKTEIKINRIISGYSYTRFEIEQLPYDASRKINAMRDELQYELGIMDVCFGSVGGGSKLCIDVPDKERRILGLREVLESDAFVKAESPLTVAVGKDIYGNVVTADLSRRNYIVAGQTSSGKTVLLNGFIMSLLSRLTPREIRLVLIDPKRVEFGIYEGLPHLLNGKVITESVEAYLALKWAWAEMDRRYELFGKGGYRSLKDYNSDKKNSDGYLPEIVFVIDEFADLMASEYKKDAELLIMNLTAKARYAGIHIVLATQRPDTVVLTGCVKSNITGRIAFKTTTQIDTRNILNAAACAEYLTGRGDMLFITDESLVPLRIQGAYVGKDEIAKTVEFIKNN